MKSYRIQLELLSPLITPLKGDTIFGHLCWGIRYQDGEESLIKFLESYEETPPIIISDAFPQGWLPKPLLEPRVPEDNQFEAYKKIKAYNKISQIPSALLIKDNFLFSEKRLFQYWNKNGFKANQKLADTEIKEKITEYQLHNSINRLIGTAQEGILYSTTETFYNANELSNIFDLYLLTSLPEADVSNYMKLVFQSGYGADKSTGKGVIEIKSMEPIQFPEKGNRLMALSSFVPAENLANSNLRGDIFTRFGKLGGDFASTINPFKKPIVMYKTAATFDQNNNRKWIGTLLSDVHSDPRIKHYAYAPLIPYQEKTE